MSPCMPASACCFSSATSCASAPAYLSPRRSTDLRLTRLWLDYTLVTGIIALGLVLALPALVAVLGARP